MDRLNFYVSETDLAKTASDLKNDTKVLDSIVATMESITSNEEICCLYCYEDFYSLQVNGQDVSQLIFEHMNDGDIRDLVVRLQIVLAASVSPKMDNAPVTGADALQAQNAGGWISTDSPYQNGWWNPQKMFWVASKDQTVSALRDLFVSCNLSHTLLDKFAKYLFPNIYFHAPPSGIKGTSLDYATILVLYLKHLAYLNDHAYEDFANEVQPNILIAIAGGRGVDMSPESPQTHKNKDAMKEREIAVGGVSVCCEWHTKLDNTRGRIHFYPWQHKDPKVKKITGQKIIVGIIAEHLT
jgi:hypothetical protein